MTRLFHVSDVHFGREDPAALDWFAARVKAAAPDAVLMTGDLTSAARRHEFAAAADWLEGLGVPLTVEAGNHDLPYFNVVERFWNPYRRFHAIERVLERPLALPGVRIVPLKTTARFQWRLNWAEGHVDAASLAGAVEQVRAAGPEDVVLVACHHPLIDTRTRVEARTRGGRAALDALAAAGADAVLSGHVHDPFAIEHHTAHGPVHLIGAGTLSERVRTSRPSFNEITIAEGRITVVAQLLAAPLASEAPPPDPDAEAKPPQDADANGPPPFPETARPLEVDTPL